MSMTVYESMVENRNDERELKLLSRMKDEGIFDYFDELGIKEELQPLMIEIELVTLTDIIDNIENVTEDYAKVYIPKIKVSLDEVNYINNLLQETNTNTNPDELQKLFLRIFTYYTVRYHISHFLQKKLTDTEQDFLIFVDRLVKWMEEFLDEISSEDSVSIYDLFEHHHLFASKAVELAKKNGVIIKK